MNDGGGIFSVDLTTGNRTGFSNEFATFGISLDQRNNRLLVFQPSKNLIVAVNLTTNESTIFSDSDSTIGSGAFLFGSNDISLDKANNRTLIITKSGIGAVNLETGNRTILTSGNIGTGTDFVSPRGMTIDTTNKRVLGVCRT